MSEPPVFLAAAGHPLRWRLLGELARGDRPVHELTALVGQPQNLVSYHLAKLRTAELVRARRSTADRRDTYYALDLARCSALLADAGGALHPGLRMSRPGAVLTAYGRVLFLCTGNSSRSQMAEALLRSRTAGRIEAFSAGSNPKPIHPYAVKVMADRQIDLADARSKHLSEFDGERFDRVITLCDRVREVCPPFPAETVHWSVPEPRTRPDFDAVADELDERIGFLVHTL
ncbi:ArsR family transcriptional regulator [Actinoplanes sp. CA-030573]|uniref:arsenate reductase/protein-tyrosine-phosphatase family protein n=1 Tax=Actinoplanes sp. CA-030573 TaxID=3239898 RepID=UPI003D8B42AC